MIVFSPLLSSFSTKMRSIHKINTKHANEPHTPHAPQPHAAGTARTARIAMSHRGRKSKNA
jgi:hypothetical protein